MFRVYIYQDISKWWNFMLHKKQESYKFKSKHQFVEINSTYYNIWNSYCNFEGFLSSLVQWFNLVHSTDDWPVSISGCCSSSITKNINSGCLSMTENRNFFTFFSDISSICLYKKNYLTKMKNKVLHLFDQFQLGTCFPKEIFN